MVPRVGEWPMHDRSAHATHTGCSDWLRDRHVCGLSQASGGRCWAFGGHAGSDPSSRREWRPVGRHTTLTPRWCLHTARLAAGFRVPGASPFPFIDEAVSSWILSSTTGRTFTDLWVSASTLCSLLGSLLIPCPPPKKPL